MNNHLSQDQLSMWILGRSTAEELRHGRECPECRAELARFETPVSAFRSVMLEWSDRESAPRIEEVSNLLRRPRHHPQHVLALGGRRHGGDTADRDPHLQTGAGADATNGNWLGDFAVTGHRCCRGRECRRLADGRRERPSFTNNSSAHGTDHGADSDSGRYDPTGRNAMNRNRVLLAFIGTCLVVAVAQAQVATAPAPGQRGGRGARSGATDNVLDLLAPLAATQNAQGRGGSAANGRQRGGPTPR